MSEPPTRTSPPSLTALGPLNWLLWRLISRAAKVPDAHLFSTLGQHKKLFRAWLRFSAQLMPGGLLGRHDTELVILRVAHLRRCDYELDHHVRLAARVGIDESVIARVFAGPSADGWSAGQRALLSAVDALVSEKDLPDERWSALREHYDEARAIELCLLVGQYEMLATAIRALRIPRDF